jgi:hypothetical protein
VYNLIELHMVNYIFSAFSIGDHARLEKGTFIAKRWPPNTASYTIWEGNPHGVLSKLDHFLVISILSFSFPLINYFLIISFSCIKNMPRPLEIGIICYKIRKIKKREQCEVLPYFGALNLNVARLHWCYTLKTLIHNILL